MKKKIRRQKVKHINSSTWNKNIKWNFQKSGFCNEFYSCHNRRGHRWNMRRMGGQNVLQAVQTKKMKKKENFSLSHVRGGPTGTQNWSHCLAVTKNIKTVASNPNTDPVFIEGMIFSSRLWLWQLTHHLKTDYICPYGESLLYVNCPLTPAGNKRRTFAALIVQ